MIVIICVHSQCGLTGLIYLTSRTEVKCWGCSSYCFCPLVRSSIGWSRGNQAHAGTGDILIDPPFPYFIGIEPLSLAIVSTQRTYVNVNSL